MKTTIKIAGGWSFGKVIIFFSRLSTEFCFISAFQRTELFTSKWLPEIKVEQDYY